MRHAAAPDAGVGRVPRSSDRGAVLSSFYYHYARLIEILSAVERIERLLDDPDILDTHVRAHAGANNSEGVGCPKRRAAPSSTTTRWTTTA